MTKDNKTSLDEAYIKYTVSWQVFLKTYLKAFIGDFFSFAFAFVAALAFLWLKSAF